MPFINATIEATFAICGRGSGVGAMGVAAVTLMCVKVLNF